MSTHQGIRALLYDYHLDLLPEVQRATVERHVTTCADCRDALVALREALAQLDQLSQAPDQARPDAYWETFPAAVDRRLDARRPRPRHSSLVSSLRDAIASALVTRRAAIASGSLSLAMAALALVLLLHPSPSRPPAVPAHEEPTALHTVPDTTDRTVVQETGADDRPIMSRADAVPVTRASGHQVSSYFRRSRVLLVGIANLQPEEPLDLATERQASRALVREARLLTRRSDVDPRAKVLIEELNRVLIGLANLAEQNSDSGIEIIRSGIRKENLLFRVRMAETVFDTTRFQPLKGARGRL